MPAGDLRFWFSIFSHASSPASCWPTTRRATPRVATTTITTSTTNWASRTCRLQSRPCAPIRNATPASAWSGSVLAGRWRIWRQPAPTPTRRSAIHGTRIHHYLDDAKAIDRPLLLHFGERDHTTPPEVLAQIIPAISGNPHVEWHIYPDAVHAFANHVRPAHYNAAATAQADQRTFGLFRAKLDPSRGRETSAT